MFTHIGGTDVERSLIYTPDVSLVVSILLIAHMNYWGKFGVRADAHTLCTNLILLCSDSSAPLSNHPKHILPPGTA